MDASLPARFPDPSPPTGLRRLRTLLTAGALVCLLPLGGAAIAEEEIEEGEAEIAELVEPTAEQLDEALDALKRAAQVDDASAALELMNVAAPYAHDKFEKLLLKLGTHKCEPVASRAVEMLERRVDEKGMKNLWKLIDQKVNKRRWPTRARIFRAYGRRGMELDRKQFKEFKSDWRLVWGDPQKHHSPALIIYVEYFQHSKDKRFCKELATQLDDPADRIGDVNAPNNPPAEWHERNWYMWQPVKPAIVAALKAITGQEFEKTEDAKKWFKENERTFGYEW